MVDETNLTDILAIVISIIAIGIAAWAMILVLNMKKPTKVTGLAGYAGPLGPITNVYGITGSFGYTGYTGYTGATGPTQNFLFVEDFALCQNTSSNITTALSNPDHTIVQFGFNSSVTFLGNLVQGGLISGSSANYIKINTNNVQYINVLFNLSTTKITAYTLYCEITDPALTTSNRIISYDNDSNSFINGTCAINFLTTQTSGLQLSFYITVSSQFADSNRDWPSLITGCANAYIVM